MNEKKFRKLLFEIAFCTMCCDGKIDEREIEELEAMNESAAFFQEIDLTEELIFLIKKFEDKGTKIIGEVFDNLKSFDLDAIQELIILEVALRIINADEVHEENEIIFLKILRSKLKVHDEMISDRFGKLDILHTNKYSNNLKKNGRLNKFEKYVKFPELDKLKKLIINKDKSNL